jgi:hypothetical protein
MRGATYIHVGSVSAVSAALEMVVPVGVECVALCRTRPRTGWGWLWDWLGVWLARRAGFTLVWADAGVPPDHVNCRCALVRREGDQ